MVGNRPFSLTLENALVPTTVFYLSISPNCGKIMTTDLQLYVRQATLISDLPEDILRDILSRLPARSVLSCECVCKRFSVLIKDPKFIDIHVNRAITSNTTTSCSVFLCGSNVTDEWDGNETDECGSDEIDEEERCDHIILENEDRSVSFSYVRLSNPISCEISIVGSCNGLFCAELKSPDDQNGSYMLIWNPITRENRYVLKPNISASGIATTLALAFGFTPETKDYKVVRIVSYYSSGKPLRLPHDVEVIKVEVYKMNTDNWTTYEITTLPCREPDHVPAQVNPYILFGITLSHITRSLKGAFHWLSDKAIVSFDLKEEQLKLFTVLDPDIIPFVELGSLDLLDGSLSLIVPSPNSNSKFDIWVMNDYGNRKSWTKQFTVEQLGFARIGYWKYDLFLMAKMAAEKRYLFFYNLKTQEREIFPVMWYFYFVTFCDYAETLETVSRAIAVAGEAVQ